jgi:hypothetical protein
MGQSLTYPSSDMVCSLHMLPSFAWLGYRRFWGVARGLLLRGEEGRRRALWTFGCLVRVEMRWFSGRFGLAALAWAFLAGFGGGESGRFVKLLFLL